MFGISGCSASRATACISTASRKVGPKRLRPRSCIGASIGTNGSGTNSVKPPVRCLQAADAQQMARPVARRVDMAEHDGRGGAQADAMRGLDHVEPLRGR